MKLKSSIIMNILIVVLVTMCTIFMFTGFTFMPAVKTLEVSGLEMFKFYTVDSNILMAIASLIFVIYEIRYEKGNIKEIPTAIYNIKFLGVAAITLTFAVTLFFLAPLYGFYAMYNNNNLFFHLIVPVLSIVSFIFIEKYDVKYKYSFIGIIPMAIYSVFYTTNVLTHLVDGKPTWEYDFYGFLFGNVKNAFISLPVILLITYLISLLLIFLNKKLLKK